MLVKAMQKNEISLKDLAGKKIAEDILKGCCYYVPALMEAEIQDLS